MEDSADYLTAMVVAAIFPKCNKKSLGQGMNTIDASVALKAISGGNNNPKAKINSPQTLF
jgi:hypothetical protein